MLKSRALNSRPEAKETGSGIGKNRDNTLNFSKRCLDNGVHLISTPKASGVRQPVPNLCLPESECFVESIEKHADCRDIQVLCFCIRSKAD
jgi:hypothetical protein